MAETLELPIFPLGSVLFPGGRLALRIFEPRYLEMTRACLRQGAPFGVCLIRAGFEVGVPAIPCEVGCTARILDWQMPAPEQYSLVAQGECRFRILERRTTGEGLIQARVELEEPPDPQALPRRHQALAGLLAQLIEDLGAGHFPRPHRLADAAWVGYRLAELLPVPPERKQRLLEQPEPLQVLRELEQLIRELREDD